MIPLGDAVGIGGPWAITFGLFVSMFVAVQRGWLVPGKAHQREVARADREVAARDGLIKALREEQAAEVAALRERHDTYMRLAAENHARETDGVRRDTADWRTAYHLAAEVGKVQAAQLDELVEGYRLILSLIQALPKVPQPDHSEVNDRGR